MAIKKSAKMQAAEEKLGEDLEEAIPKYVNRIGMIKASEKIGVSASTLNYWMLKFGIEYRHVAIKPGQRVKVVDKEEDSSEGKDPAVVSEKS